MASGAPKTIGDYEILEEIGHGGMGTLYRARDPRIGRDLAIKLLRGGMEDPEMRERFVREARAAGKLKHGNIVTIFELGEHDGMPFIAMEYVQGQTLAALLKQKPTLLLMRKLQMMDQVCAGLHYAHRMGIVHRDIKPANLMIDDEGTMKILDFGIARMGTSKITHTGVVIGTLNYMSPEQMKGQPTDPRSDIFSIGAVFYELLSYRSPFAGDAPSTVMHKVLYGSPDQLELICPNLDPSLVAIVARCLQKQPADRYPDLAAVRAALGGVMNLLQASGAETVLEVTRPVSGPIPEPPKKDRGKAPSSDRKDGASMDRVRARAEETRKRQLQSHLENAQRAFEQGSYDLVFASCEQALVLDPSNPQALELEARARTELEHEARQRLAEARAEIDRGALTAASQLVDLVLALSPESSDAQAVRQSIEEARVRLALEQERARERERALAQFCADAERYLANGSFENASEAVQRALNLEPNHQAALDLKDKIAKAAASREAARKADDEARARKSIDEAKKRFSAGDQFGALSMLEGLAQSHPTAASALDALRLEAKEIERRKVEADRARLEEEAARLKRETDAARAKLEAELERVKREREEGQKQLEAEAAQFKRERDAERQRADAERKKAEEARLQAEAERKHVETERQQAEAERKRVESERQQAEAERKHAEAERQRLAREADAARAAREEAAREKEAARVAAEAEARRARERQREASVTVDTLYEPRTAAPVTRPDPPRAPRYEPTPVAAKPANDLPKFVALALMGIATLTIATVLIMRTLGRSSETATPAEAPAPAPQVEQPPAVAQTPPASPAAIEQPPASPQAAEPPSTPPSAASPAAPPPAAAPPLATPPPSQQPPSVARGVEPAQTPPVGRPAAGTGAAAPTQPSVLQPTTGDNGATQRLADARQALDNGSNLERSGDIVAALAQFERSRQLNPSPTADAAVNRLRTRMRTEGSAAFINGRQYDALDRIEQAIAAYEVAVRYLTDDDPNKQAARDRLAVLRVRQKSPL